MGFKNAPCDLVENEHWVIPQLHPCCESGWETCEVRRRPGTVCWWMLSSSLLCIVCTSAVFLIQKDPQRLSETALLCPAVQRPLSASSPVCGGHTSSPKLGGRPYGHTV